ncbi:ACP S-malonyltransferase [Frondihabitans australicus]|uniref:[acyl-carrier-protein] S-malonyltransferase n=1 Tax=Frondihabitans australicus TaxID=386892 RepID=A0A495ID93_9MICO|nr:ACP S-malonyltransferase [Frondihabitans australicus]RKR73974.1 [acyl-carrier-protein] S-malonyltransferase [Frondihabitans australicus]
MIVLAAPGQGSQTPGFLTPWIDDPDSGDEARALLAQLSEASGVDLVAHGTVSDAETIRDTAIAQPLIVAAGLLTARALFQRVSADTVGAVAGHSVGELTAAALAGVISEGDAVSLVTVRAKGMAAAAAETPTGMSAVLGADEAELLAKLDELGLEPANFNGGGQIVVAGALEALAKLADEPPARARVIPLQVAGAFHTRYMGSAIPALREAAAAVQVSDPATPIFTNHDGSRVASGREYLDLLVSQVASPVRWDKTMESFLAAGVTGQIELAPAGALTGLAKRGMKGVPSVAIKTPDDLQAAVDLLQGAAS